MNEPEPQNVTDFLAANGHCLVLGGPGSGKTTLALRKAVTRIQREMKAGQAVLFLSFSRAAVTRLIEAGAHTIPRDSRDKLVVQTFHGFFWNLLTCHAYLLGAPNLLQILMPHDERAISHGINPNHSDWPAWKQKQEQLFLEEGRIAFDLFAPMTLHLLRASTSIKNLITQKYPLIIVDEAQDTGQHAWETMCELKNSLQIICLADLDQQIFDYLPGVGPERIVAIRHELAPLEIDLGHQNNRSPGTEITIFGNDIIHNNPRGQAYLGVSQLNYHPKNDPNAILRRSIAIAYRKARAKGAKPESCAILAATGREVAQISEALSNGPRRVAHRVVFDEALSLLASRLAAFMLEPKRPAPMENYVIEALEMLANIENASGTATGRKTAIKLRRWASDYAGGKKLPLKGIGPALRDLMTLLHSTRFTGDPRTDWLRVRDGFRASTDNNLVGLAGHLDYLVAFGRGRFIANNLLSRWQATGTYAGARVALDTALAQDAIMETSQDLSGIHVMTVHRAKGKQFDCVIILRKGLPVGNKKWQSSFVWRGDAPPYQRSRKILRVAVTRAKQHVLILNPFFPKCPLLAGHSL